MKVQIIQLEPEDDHVSTRDRLSWTQAEKAVLVWPRSGKPLAERLDLVLVQRHAERLGIELALVSYDPKVVASAKRLGIPVFESLEALPNGSWQSETALRPNWRPSQPTRLEKLHGAREAIGDFTTLQLNPPGRVAAVAVAAVAILAAAAAVVPGASVAIEPESAPISEALELAFDPSLPATASGELLPASWATTQVSGDMQTDTTGRIRAPEAAATGEVLFTNLTEEPLTVPAGTGLRAGEVRFLTDEDLDLVDEPASVAITAAQPGRAGNVAAETIDSVEGSLGFLVQVINPTPTGGGRDVLTRAVSEDDRQHLQELLIADLLDRADAALGQELGSQRMVAPGTVRLARVVEQQFDHQAGEISNQLSLRMTLEVEGLSFDRAQAEGAIESRLANSVPSGRFVVPGSVSFTPVSSELELQGARVLFRVRAAEAHQLDLGSVRRAARGASAATIPEVLETRFRLARPATVDLRPGWLPWMPLLEIRIQVDWLWNAGA